jgi:hypothetical protein
MQSTRQLAGLIKALLRWGGLLLMVWLVLIIGILTPALNVAVPFLAERQTGKPLQLGVLLINPITFAMTAESITLAEPDGRPRISIEALMIEPRVIDSLKNQRLIIDSVELLALRAQPADHQNSALEWERLSLDDIQIDPTNRRLSFRDISVASPMLATDFIDNRSTINTLWDDLTQKNEKPSTAESESAAWSFTIKQLNLVDGELSLNTDLLSPEMFRIAPFMLQINDLAWPAGEETSVIAKAELGSVSQLNLQAKLWLDSGIGESSIQLAGLPISWFEPVLIDQAGVTVSDGLLKLDSNIGWREFLPETAKADVQLRQLAVGRPGDEAPMLASRNIQIAALTLDANQQLLEIGRVDVDGLNGRVHIFEDGSINLLQLTGVAREVEEDSTLYAQEIAEAEDQTDIQPWSIRVLETSFSDSVIDFRDDTLPIDFTAHVEDLEGELSGFDTRTDSEATFSATGNINGYSPVEIEGSIGHFSDIKQGGLRFKTRGVDLGRLTPYTATYASYPIERGVLALDLDYTVVNGFVKGNNHVRIDQLALGERQESEQSVIDLPLQTAVALLSDAAGVIDLSLPVEGPLDDPEFDIWAAAGKAFFNLASNLIAAPFKFLASLVGDDNVPERLVFSPGSTTLAPEVESALSTLSAALTQRPRIALRLTPHIDAIADTQALRRQAFREQLLATGASEADIAERTALWQQLVERLAAEAGLDPAQPHAELRKSLIEAVEISPDMLDALATKRASEVKRYLVEIEGMDPQRAAIAATNENADENFAGVSMEVRVR